MKIIACIMKVLEILMTKDPGTILTKRDLFYQQVGLFKRQSVVDAIINGLARACNVPRRELGVMASPKGLAFGHLQIGGFNFNQAPGTIPMLNDMLITHCELPQTLLIVEKEAVFYGLVQIYNRLNLSKLLLITARGFPDLVTQQFVYWLTQKGGLSLTFILVDYDPYGLDIALSYRRGSNLPADRPTSCCPNLTYLGVSRQQLDYYRPHSVEGTRQALTSREVKRLKRIGQQAQESDWIEVVQAANDMLAAEFTAEIEEIYHYDLDQLAVFVNNEIGNSKMALMGPNHKCF